MHFSPKDLELDAGFLGLLSNSPALNSETILRQFRLNLWTVTLRQVECGCMILLFTIQGECVVISEMGQRLKSRLTVI